MEPLTRMQDLQPTYDCKLCWQNLRQSFCAFLAPDTCRRFPSHDRWAKPMTAHWTAKQANLNPQNGRANPFGNFPGERGIFHLVANEWANACKMVETRPKTRFCHKVDAQNTANFQIESGMLRRRHFTVFSGVFDCSMNILLSLAILFDWLFDSLTCLFCVKHGNHFAQCLGKSAFDHGLFGAKWVSKAE